jgi:decaprenylphospho-beta-D-erythro-pentofuranosid-2-ulose 2-reductase
MDNAFGQPQTILVLGGTSDIGVAIAKRLMSPVTRAVVLACRDVVAGERVAATLRDLRPGGVAQDRVVVEVIEFDAAATATHEHLVADVVARHGDLDVVVLAFGQLGDGEATGRDVAASAALANVNFTGAVASSVAVGEQLRRQGHGALVVLSSVAGERVRKANFVYGATKAGLDGFAQGLGDSLAGSGARVLVVRPGFVHSAMTAGMPAAPFATTPDAVAEATASGLRRGSRTVWAPGILRVVFSVLRHLPGPVWRRLPLG